MGTRCHLVLPGVENSRAERICNVIKQEVNRVETCLSRFIPYSEISVINQQAGMEPVVISDEIFDVLNTCLEYKELTAGAFDITLRPLLKYWKNRSSNDDPARHNELMNALGSKQIVLNKKDQSVFLRNKKVEIDLGGFGKGYSLEKVQNLFRNFAVDNAFISFGESSILTLGSHPAGDHWKIGLNDYTNPGQSVYTFSLNEGSVSTSSNFYVDDHGKLQNHRHVISPYTGYPVEDLVTVSVRSASPVEAEVLSTAFLVMTDKMVEEIKNEIPDCDIVKVNYAMGRPEVQILKEQQNK